MKPTSRETYSSWFVLSFGAAVILFDIQKGKYISPNYLTPVEIYLIKYISPNYLTPFDIYHI